MNNADMSLSITLIAVATGLLLTALVIKAMEKRTISEYQGIPWLIAALVLIVLGVWPDLLLWAASLFGITWPPAVLVFAVIVGFGFILFNHSQEISVLKSQNTELSMQIGVLKEQLREKENGESGENK